MSLRKTILSLAALCAPVVVAGCAKHASGTTCDPDAPNTICTIAGGSGAAGYGGDEGPATKALLYTPQGTAWGPDGQLWLLDYNNYVVRSIDGSGTIHTRVGIGLLGDSPDTADGQTECPALQAKFNHTPDMFFSGNSLYLAAWHGSWIKKVDLTTMMVTDVVGEGMRTHYTGEGGPALKAAVDLPAAVVIAPNGDIVLMDQANQVIRRVDGTGTINRMAGTCLVSYYDTGEAPCTKGTVLQQCSTVDPGSDKATYCVTDPVNLTLAEVCGWPCEPGFSGDGGPALAAQIGQQFGQQADPNGRLAYDSAGNLYFTDTLNNRIRKIDPSGIITTIAGKGVYGVDAMGNILPTATGGYAGDGGPALDAVLNHPVDLAIDTDNTIYFTDTNNNCVRKIDPSGIISTVVGDCTTANLCGSVNSASCNSDVGAVCTTDTTTCFKGDGGPPTSALLNHPYAVSLHGKKLYVSDTYNNRIRVVNLP
jgi:streptogramin lyase